MKGRNVCTFIGNVGQAPEKKYTTSGTARLTFSLAINKRWKNGEETQEKTTWVNCIAWDKLAELGSQYLAKGDPVHVEAEFELKEWSDDGGIKHKTPQFIVHDLIFLGSKDRHAAADVPF